MHSESAIRLSAPQLERATRIEHHGLLRIPLFLLLYCFAAGSSVQIATLFDHSWLLALPLYLLAGASLHGISLFTHEGVHGLLHPNRTLNHILGSVTAWPVLQTFAAYRVLHLKHHAHLGESGDPDHYRNYNRRRWGVFAMHWGRLLFGYPAYLMAIPFLALRQGTGWERFQILMELLVLGLLILAILSSQLPWIWFLHGWLIPMGFIHFMVNIRGMSQHTLLEHSQSQIMGTRTIITTPLVRFFMCNENYHLEHHIHPRIPWYHLSHAHQLLRPQLEAIHAPFIDTYFAFVKDFVVSSFTGKRSGTVDIQHL